MEKGIIILVAIIGIVIINLINRNKPSYMIGGTVIITAGCVLGLLYYFRISEFPDVGTIVATVLLSAALLLLAYFLVLFAVNYSRGKASVKKREQGKRKEKASVSVKKLGQGESAEGYRKKVADRQRVMVTEGGEAIAEEEPQVLIRKSSGKKRMKHDDRSATPEFDRQAYARAKQGFDEQEAALRDEPEAPADEWNRETRVEADTKKPRKRGNAKAPAFVSEDLETAEEWQPDTVSEDERRAYLEKQYAWMDEQDSEDEVNLSVVFAGADGDDFADEPEPEDEVPVARASRGRKLDGEIPDVEPVLSRFVELDADGQQQFDLDEIAPAMRAHRDRGLDLQFNEDETEEALPEELLDVDDIAAADGLAEEEYLYGEEEEYYWEEPAAQAGDATDEPGEEDSLYEEEWEPYEEEAEEAPVYAEEQEEPVYEEPAADEEYEIADEEPLAAEEPVYDVIEEEEAAYDEEGGYEIEYEEELEEVAAEEQPAEAYEEEAEAAVTEPEETAAEAAVTEPEETAAEAAVTEPEETAVEAAVTEPEETAAEAVEEEPEDDPAAEKNAAMTELKQLIARRQYNDSLRKVFEILNKGYVMTPDEKQQMKIIMLMLKEKT